MTVTATEPDDLPEQMRVRRDKLSRMRAEGQDPYPLGFPRTTDVAALRERFGDLEPDTATGERVGLAGRVVLNRPSGKIGFATLRDGSGDLQVMLSLDAAGEDALARWKRDVDLGDHVGVEGEVITSRRGELSVLVSRWVTTAKALRPLPEKWKGLTDPEARVRQRYVDLIVNPDARRLVEVRAVVLRSLRATLDARGYVEVETSVLQPMHGGAAARPFSTHVNAFDQDMYLRIALELPLKRMVVGGIERVYEIGRTFRNEGVDTTHNPEFTMLEAYEAYGDYDTMAELTRALVLEAAEAVGSTVITGSHGEIDLAEPWHHVTVHEAVSRAVGRPVDPGLHGRGADRASPSSTGSPCNRAGPRGRSCSSCSRSSWSTRCSTRPSSATTPRTSGRWRDRTATIRGWPRRGTSSSAGWSSRRRTPSWSTPWSSAGA